MKHHPALYLGVALIGAGFAGHFADHWPDLVKEYHRRTANATFWGHGDAKWGTPPAKPNGAPVTVSGSGDSGVRGSGILQVTRVDPITPNVVQYSSGSGSSNIAAVQGDIVISGSTTGMVQFGGAGGSNAMTCHGSQPADCSNSNFITCQVIGKAARCTTLYGSTITLPLSASASRPADRGKMYYDSHQKTAFYFDGAQWKKFQ